MKRIRRIAHRTPDERYLLLDAALESGFDKGLARGRLETSQRQATRLTRMAQALNESQKEMRRIRKVVCGREMQTRVLYKRVEDLGKQLKAAQDYAERLLRHLDPKLIETILDTGQEKRNGVSVNEAKSPEKSDSRIRGWLGGTFTETVTGRTSSDRINFADIRPRGNRFSDATPSNAARPDRLLQAYGAGPETIRRFLSIPQPDEGEEGALNRAETSRHVATQWAERQINRVQFASRIRRAVGPPAIPSIDLHIGERYTVPVTGGPDENTHEEDLFDRISREVSRQQARRLDEEITRNLGAPRGLLSADGATSPPSPEEGVLRDAEGNIFGYINHNQVIVIPENEEEEDSDEG